MDPFAAIVKALLDAQVRLVVMGVWGINYYAQSGATLFTTADRDMFLPPDPANLLQAWSVCEQRKLALWAGREPLDSPRDLLLAQRVVKFRAATSAIGDDGLQIDLSLVMAGFDFEHVWARRRIFLVDGVSIPVARLTDIVQSKATAGRDKDRLFLATHAEAIRGMLEEDR